MSEFVECKTKFKDKKALVEALIAMGWTANQIEVNEVAQNLYGYQGDKRNQKANIIIRRKNVGGASNDIGFVKKPDGTYEAIISEYDRHAANGTARCVTPTARRPTRSGVRRASIVRRCSAV